MKVILFYFRVDIRPLEQEFIQLDDQRQTNEEKLIQIAEEIDDLKENFEEMGVV
jgi:hypothetical protein